MSTHALFGHFTAHPGRRDDLVDVLLEAAALMASAEGCLTYNVHTAGDGGDRVYVYEEWRSEADHDASLHVEGVGALIQRAMPLLAEPPAGGLKLTRHR